MNPDPLLGLPEQERLLFDAFKKAAAGKNVDAVIGASINLLVNVIRQMESTRGQAEARYDMLTGRGKTLLLDRHYDSTTGKRKTIFPFTQQLGAAFIRADDEVRG